MKELFNSFSPLFTEFKNSNSSSRYLRLSAAGYRGNRTFPYILIYTFPHLGRFRAKKGQKSKILPGNGPIEAKNQNLKNLYQNFFTSILYSNLAKFQVYRTIFSPSL